MKNNKLFQTNLLVSSILVVGFILTAFFSYRANYRASLENIEQVSSLTAEGIYYQLSAMLTKPVNISLTMAHDSLLVDHLLAEESRMDARILRRLQKRIWRHTRGNMVLILCF